MPGAIAASHGFVGNPQIAAVSEPFEGETTVAHPEIAGVVHSARTETLAAFVVCSQPVQFTLDLEVLMRWRLMAFLSASLFASPWAAPVLGAPGVSASVGEIRGRAVDAADTHGLSGVTVSIRGESRVTSSGRNGAFILGGVPAGARIVECALGGYLPALVSVDVRPGGIHQIRCELKSVAPGKTLAAATTPPAGAHPTGDPTGEVPVVHMPPAEVDNLLGSLDSVGNAAPAGGSAGFGRIHGMGRIETSSRSSRGSVSLGSVGTIGYGAGAASVSGQGYSAASVVVRGYAPSPAPATAFAMGGPLPPRAGTPPGQEASREGYEGIVENAFLGVTQEPLSTFSIDVDAASYSNVRRFLRGNSRPPRDAVRIEELINYFRYDYADPAPGQPFSINTEVSVAPWNPEHRLVRIGLQGQRIPAAHLPPANLTFLIDVSGSMNDPRKLPLLKQSFRLLVDQLRSQDRVSLVVYAGAAGVVLPPTEGSDKGRIIEALENLQAGGSTAGAAGIRLAYQTARESFVRGGNNRVILATDGDFNVGTSSDAELVQLIEQERKSGVFLTLLGYGMGNYQDAKMQKLADAGNGNHAYIDSLDEARKTLVAEMGATLLTVAKDVKIQVEFNPARVKAYRLIGYENRRLANADFNNDQKDAGELGAGHSVTVLYELVPAGSRETIHGVDELKYQQVTATAAAGGDELLTVKLRYKAPDAETSQLLSRALVDTHTPVEETSDDFRFATAVAEFGLLLRESPHRGTASFGAVLTRAQGALGANTGGLRTGFLELVRSAQTLYGQAVAR